MTNIRVLTSILSFLFSLTCSSQDTTNNSMSMNFQRHNISFSIGANYYYIFGGKHLSMDTTQRHPEDGWPGGGFVGSTFKPSVFFHSGITYNYAINKTFKIETGLLLHARSYGLIKDNDTIERNIVNNFNIKYSYALDTLKEARSTEYIFEIPLYISLIHKRFSVLIGSKFIISSIGITKNTYIENTKTNNFYTYYFFSTGYKFGDIVIPSLKLKYLIKDKKIPISIYFTIDRLYSKNYDFQTGLEINFLTLK